MHNLISTKRKKNLCSLYNLQCIDTSLCDKLVITDIKLVTRVIPPTWWDEGRLQLPGVPMHAGGVSIELEASFAQSVTLLHTAHSLAVEELWLTILLC